MTLSGMFKLHHERTVGIGWSGVFLSDQREIGRCENPKERCDKSSERAALIGPVSVDHSGAWQVGCQPVVLEGVDHVPEPRGRRYHLAMCFIQDLRKSSGWHK
jgi:hypothetical protein